MTVAAHTTGFHRVRRGWKMWVAFLVVGSLMALFVGWLQGLSDTEPPKEYDSTSAAPNGSRALVQQLRALGVTVDRVEEIPDTSAKPSTIVVTTPHRLTDDDLDALVDHSGDIVLLAPSSYILEELARSTSPSPVSAGLIHTKTSTCAVNPAAKSPTLFGEFSYYQAPVEGVGACHREAGPPPDELGPLAGRELVHAAYLRLDPDSPLSRSSATVHVVGMPRVFSNSLIRYADNAAFALNITGKHDTVHWYVPPPRQDLEIQPLAAPDVWPRAWEPLIWLALLTGLVAIVWQGRRFGRVVREEMPVHVQSGESVQGLATLYRRAGAYTRAAELVRTATVRKLARIVGVPLGADRATLVAEVARNTSRTEIDVSDVLAVNAHDAGELTTCIRQLDDLLDDARHGVRHGAPESSRPLTNRRPARK